MTESKIERLLREWLARLPHPFSSTDRRAGYRYALWILPAEFSRTQVLDRPVVGRIFFEEVIRENLDLGRPGQVHLIFNRRVNARTPGRFRTRVLTEGVTPSTHIDYKHSRIKQYHKEGQALRTETTINDTYDFSIGRRLNNLPALRKVGFEANQRLLDVQRISHDCALGEDAFQRLQQPLALAGQRASALRFADTRVQALLHALVLSVFLARGFSNHDLRKHLAPLLGLSPSELTPGRMTTCGDCGCTASLSVCRVPTATDSHPRDYKPRSSTPASTRVSCARGNIPTPPHETLQRTFRAAEQAVNSWCREAFAHFDPLSVPPPKGHRPDLEEVLVLDKHHGAVLVGLDGLGHHRHGDLDLLLQHLYCDKQPATPPPFRIGDLDVGLGRAGLHTDERSDIERRAA